MSKIKKCKNCGNEFKGKGFKFCGSREDKIGCAYEVKKEYTTAFNRRSYNKKNTPVLKIPDYKNETVSMVEVEKIPKPIEIKTSLGAFEGKSEFTGTKSKIFKRTMTVNERKEKSELHEQGYDVYSNSDDSWLNF